MAAASKAHTQHSQRSRGPGIFDRAGPTLHRLLAKTVQRSCPIIGFAFRPIVVGGSTATPSSTPPPWDLWPSASPAHDTQDTPHQHRQEATPRPRRTRHSQLMHTRLPQHHSAAAESRSPCADPPTIQLSMGAPRQGREWPTSLILRVLLLLCSP